MLDLNADGALEELADRGGSLSHLRGVDHLDEPGGVDGGLERAVGVCADRDHRRRDDGGNILGDGHGDA
jgi:hypothetical protein